MFFLIFIGLSKVDAFSINASSSVYVNSNVAVKIDASGLTGRFDISSSNENVLAGSDSKWIEDETITLYFTAKSVGNATITVKGSKNNKSTTYSLKVIETKYMEIDCASNYPYANAVGVCAQPSGVVEVESTVYCQVEKSKASYISSQCANACQNSSTCPSSCLSIQTPDQAYAKCCAEHGCY